MSWSPSHTHSAKPLPDDGIADGVSAKVASFLDYTQLKGGTAQTLFGYERYLREFVLWLHGRGVNRTEQFTTALLQAYQRSVFDYRKRNGKPLAVHSQLSKLVPVRSFLKWLMRSDPALQAVLIEMELPPALSADTEAPAEPW